MNRLSENRFFKKKFVFLEKQIINFQKLGGSTFVQNFKDF